MKSILPLFLLAALSTVLAARGDDPKGGQALMESQAAATKPKEEKKPAVTTTKPATAILGQPVAYGGYFSDLVKAEKKRPLFNLKTPVDPQKDLENLWYYSGAERTYSGADKIQGVVLFSIKF